MAIKAPKSVKRMPGFKKMEKADEARDKKMGIKENSKKDMKQDAKALKGYMAKRRK